MKPHGHPNNPYMLQMAMSGVPYSTVVSPVAGLESASKVLLGLRGADVCAAIRAQASYPLETHIVLQRAKQLMEE